MGRTENTVLTEKGIIINVKRTNQIDINPKKLEEKHYKEKYYKEKHCEEKYCEEKSGKNNGVDKCSSVGCGQSDRLRKR